METKIYDQKGQEKGKVTLPESIFGVPWNADLVHQVVVSMRSNCRQPVAHTKDRGEVRGGGRKPWRQKGTGRARHGSTRSPLWVGGGVTFGPRNERNFLRKINKKMRRKALYAVLSRKLKEGEIVFLESISMDEPKTKEAAQLLDALSGIAGLEKINYKKGKRALVATPTYSKELYRVFKNIPSAHLEEIRNLNPLDAVTYKYVVVVKPEESIKVLAKE